MSDDLPLDAGMEPKSRKAEATVEVEILTCTACGRGGLKGDAGLLTHQQKHCSARADAPQRSAPIDLVPIPENRPTLAWFFRPPTTDFDRPRTDGLPRDLFYTASAWQPNQVHVQTRKTFLMPSGVRESVRLVNPIDAHGLKKRGVPVIAMHDPDWTDESRRNWERICEVIDENLPRQIEIEESVITDLREEIQEGGFVGPLRADMRQRLRSLEAHVEALQRGVDFNALFAFFVSEAQRSQATLRSPEARLRDVIRMEVDVQRREAAVA